MSKKEIIKLNDKRCECGYCGFKGKGFKELKMIGEIGSFRARCPKCKKVNVFLIIVDNRK